MTIPFTLGASGDVIGGATAATSVNADGSYRYVLDFGQANGGLTPPKFVWFRDAATHTDLPQPTVYQSGGASWTYYFDFKFPVSTSSSTMEIEYGITVGNNSLTGQILAPNYQPTRFFLDFGSGAGSQTPPTFAYFRDEATGTNLTAPTVFASKTPAWNYYFDVTWPTGTSAIACGIAFSGVSLSGVLVAPTATLNLGGANTLLALRNFVRQEADAENDPNISDDELTGWINQSRLRLYAKLVTSFGDDYYVSTVQFTTDGVSSSFALPNGSNYGGSPAFFKALMLEAVSGGNISPNSPITLLPFNLREKNRYTRPFSMLAVPGFFPRYRIMGSNIVFTPTPPAAGLTCQLWYAPQLAPLVNDYDVADDWSGWLELVIVDCVIKALLKQDRDASAAMARKAELVASLEKEIANRNVGEPNTVIETESENLGPFGLPGMGSWGGGWY